MALLWTLSVASPGRVRADVFADGFEDLSGSALAAQYPGDIGLESDPAVLFVEMGEEATLAELFARWSSNSTSNSVALDTSTFAPGSPGKQSIRLFTTGGAALPAPGPIRTALLRRQFPLFAGSTVHARWYVKYNSVGTLHHSGPRLGGLNPTLPGPIKTAGVRPNGTDFFLVGAETAQGKVAPVSRSTFDFYAYWPGMHHNSFFPEDTWYGNSLINDPEVAINTDDWTCIEVRLTLNSPLEADNGAVAMWIDGVLVADIRPGTPGIWVEDAFSPTPAGAPFEGFGFRRVPELTFSYFDLLHYVDNDRVEGFVNSVHYDHVVVATRYIGPLTPSATGKRRQPGYSTVSR